MPYIETCSLTRRYGKGDSAVTALDSVSLAIEKGTFTAVTGASGSGKSTLLHLLAGIDTPTSGTVKIGGTDLFSLSGEKSTEFRRDHIGLVFQSYQLLPVLTVLENIVLPVRLAGQYPEQEYLDELISFLDLSEKLSRFPSELSGGQKQRTAIARALITRPKIILADEPTGNLDSSNSREIIRMLRTCVEKYEQTVVLVTHDPSAASEADRRIVMQDGKIIEDTAQ